MISNSDYTQDYTQEYQLAEAAYLQGNYEKAAEIIDTLVTKFHDDPSVRLLRGHIYCAFHFFIHHDSIRQEHQ